MVVEKAFDQAQADLVKDGSGLESVHLSRTETRATQRTVGSAIAGMTQGEWVSESGGGRCEKGKEGRLSSEYAVTQRSVSEDAEHYSVGDEDETNVEVTDADDYPDGGLEAWLVVLGVWCVSFCTYGWINSVGTFQAYYQSGPLKEYSPSEIAWIPSMQIFLMSFLSPFTGKIFDAFGPRLLLVGGSFLHVFGLMMASLATEYYQFMLSQGLCSAVGVSAIFLASVGALSGWFKKRRGMAFGLFATGSSVGGVVFPIMLSNMIRMVGYGWAMRTAAFIILFFLIIANATIKSRHQASKVKLSREVLGRPFHEKTFVFLLVGMALVPFGLYTPINFLPTVAKDEGMADSLAQNLVAFYNAASLFGRAGSGLLADRYGLFNIFSSACYGAGLLILALWIPGGGNDAATVAFSVLFGLFSGAYIALMAALIARISPIEEVGYRNGISQLFGSIGGLITSPIAGLILQRPNGIVGLKVFAGPFILVGTTAIVAARISKTGWKLAVRF